jgi:hypothetical protein
MSALAGAPSRALRALFLLVAAGLVAAACGPDVAGSSGQGNDADGRRLQYVLVPHPDDEYQGWALVAERSETYPVFILLTHGERTVMCDGRGFHPEHGERAPQPQPFVADDRARCAAQRLDTWHAFLDAMAALDDTLDVPGEEATITGAPPEDGPAPSHPDRPDPPLDFSLRVGVDSARAVFDLGDGDLEAYEVAWALETVRAERSRLPVTAEGDAVGAAFSNPAGLEDCVAYPHPDHAAVVDALWETDFGLPGAQYGRVCATDPRAAVVEAVPAELHEAVWGVDPPPVDPHANPDATRTGVAQEVYGWLAFTFSDPQVHRYWEVGPEAATIFSREQAFFAAHGD